MKKSIFDEQTSKALKQWHKSALKKSHRQDSSSSASSVKKMLSNLSTRILPEHAYNFSMKDSGIPSKLESGIKAIQAANKVARQGNPAQDGTTPSSSATGSGTPSSSGNGPPTPNEDGTHSSQQPFDLLS